MGKGLRACPICPSCGSKKFRIVERDEEQVTVECLSCSRRIVV
jgi:DNA-directed RNA polymerase subunit RPC12/RpoP